MSDQLDSLMPLLGRELRDEIQHLREVEAWALAQQPVQVGDAVVVQQAPKIGPESGWWTCREFLAVGSTGVVRELYFFKDHWGVLWEPDVQWYSGDKGRRTGGRPSSFYFDPKWLRKRTEDDQPLTVPSDAIPWRSS